MRQGVIGVHLKGERA